MRALHLGAQLKTILKNIGFVAIATLASRFLLLFVQSALGHLGGQAGLGGYATAVSISVYFVFLVDVGLAPRIVREGAVAPDTLAEEYARALGLKLFSAVLAMVAIGILYFVLPFDPWVRELCVWLSLGSVIRSFTYLNESVFRARERFDRESILQLVYSAIYAGPSVVLLWLGYPIRVVGIAALLAALIQFGLSLLWVRQFISISWTRSPHWRTLYQSLPYASTSLTITAFAQIDVLLLALVATQEMVGEYSAVSRLLLVVGTMSGIAVSAVVPAAARIYVTETQERYRNVVNGALRFTAYLGGAATVGAICVAPYLVGLIYGAAFQKLYPLLQLGSVYLAIRFLNSILEALLTSCGRQGGRARAVGFGAIVTVISVLGLAPVLGVLGAVLAMILSEVALLCCLVFFMRDFLSGALLRRTSLYVSLATGGAAAVYLLLTQEPRTLVQSGFATLAALTVFGAVFLLSGEAKEIVRFFGITRRRS